jgi:hypothetical protein
MERSETVEIRKSISTVSSGQGQWSARRPVFDASWAILWSALAKRSGDSALECAGGAGWMFGALVPESLPRRSAPAKAASALRFAGASRHRPAGCLRQAISLRSVAAALQIGPIFCALIAAAP